MTTIVATSLAIFIVGFFLGDRRAVRQCNAILDDHWRELMKSIRDDRSGFPSDTEDGDMAVRPTLH